MHKTTDSKVRQQQTIKLLPHQVRRLAAQHDFFPTQMRLQFPEGCFNLPSFVVQGGQLHRRRCIVIKNRCDQPVKRFGAFHPFQAVLDNPDQYAITAMLSVLRRRKMAKGG